MSFDQSHAGHFTDEFSGYRPPGDWRDLANAFRWLRLGVLLAFGSVWSAAASAQAAASGRITMLNVPAHGQFVRVQLDTSVINPGNCQAAEFYIIELSAPTANRILGALYAAHASRANVTMWIQGCPPASE